MKLPSGATRLKKRAKIPVYVEGEKKPRFIYEIPEIVDGIIQLQTLANALEYVARGPRTDGSDAKVAKDALKKLKEWK